MANEWAKIEAIEQKKNGEIELSPREAIIAMLDGEVLDRGHKVVEKWDGKHFVYQIIGEKGWTPKPMDGEFVGLRRFSKQKKQPMDTFECLAWVNSAESQGWMVSCKAETDYKWSSWDIPQRFKYDGREERKDCVSYRRARVLPDKSVIDESTIQGFLKEV
jgi:hypothetical protein